MVTCLALRVPAPRFPLRPDLCRPHRSLSDETINRDPSCMYILMQKDHQRTLKIPYFTSEFRGLWQNQTNPASTSSRLGEVGVGGGGGGGGYCESKPENRRSVKVINNNTNLQIKFQLE